MKKENKYLIAIIAIVFLLAIASVSAFVVLYEPVQQLRTPETPPQQPPTTPPAKPPVTPVTYDDTEFFDWMKECNNDLYSYNTLVSYYAKDYDYDSLSDLGYRYYNKVNDYKTEIISFHCSYTYSELKTEYGLYLDDQSNACWYLYMGGKYVDADYIDTATSYTKKATEHIETCTEIIQEL